MMNENMKLYKQHNPALWLIAHNDKQPVQARIDKSELEPQTGKWADNNNFRVAIKQQKTTSKTITGCAQHSKTTNVNKETRASVKLMQANRAKSTEIMRKQIAILNNNFKEGSSTQQTSNQEITGNVHSTVRTLNALGSPRTLLPRSST